MAWTRHSVGMVCFSRHSWKRCCSGTQSAKSHDLRTFGPIPSKPIALEASSDDRAVKTSDSEIWMDCMIVVLSGFPMEDGITYELCINTEWKYPLNRFA